METNNGRTPSDKGAVARWKRPELSAELLPILPAGAALAALIPNGIGEIREDMRERFSSMEGRLGVVEREQGEIRGLLEGIRDTAAGRPKPAAAGMNDRRGDDQPVHQSPEAWPHHTPPRQFRRSWQ